MLHLKSIFNPDSSIILQRNEYIQLQKIKQKEKETSRKLPEFSIYYSFFFHIQYDYYYRNYGDTNILYL